MEQKNQRYAAFKEKASGFLKRNGFTVVLGLCVAVIGIAAAVTLLPVDEPDPTPPAATPIAQAASQSRDQALTQAMATPTPTAGPSPTPAPSAATPKPETKKATKAAAPLEGDIVWEYAADQLIYSVTLEQWTTHPGIDISAKAGAEVKCVLNGEVEQVYEDNALGTVVLVSHSGGKQSLYGNLKPEVPVKAGDKVQAAQVIGYVGSTAVSECMLPSHLHFGFLVDGKPQNPKDYVLLGK